MASPLKRADKSISAPMMFWSPQTEFQSPITKFLLPAMLLIDPLSRLESPKRLLLDPLTTLMSPWMELELPPITFFAPTTALALETIVAAKEEERKRKQRVAKSRELEEAINQYRRRRGCGFKGDGKQQNIFDCVPRNSRIRTNIQCVKQDNLHGNCGSERRIEGKIGLICDNILCLVLDRCWFCTFLSSCPDILHYSTWPETFWAINLFTEGAPDTDSLLASPQRAA